MAGHRGAATRGYKIAATPGMIAAYNDGLSVRAIGLLWEMNRTKVHSMLRCSGVAMRGKGTDGPPPSAEMMAHYRKVARQELEGNAPIFRQPALATPGMISAYNSNLSSTTIGELWGGLSCTSVNYRLRNSGVELRPPRRMMASEKPSDSIIAHFRMVAAKEIAQIEEGSDKRKKQKAPPLNPGDDDTGERRGPFGGPAEGCADPSR